MNDTGGLQHRDPPLHGCHVYVHRVRNVAHVEQLSRSSGTSDHEVMEGPLVPHLDQLAHIALDIGTYVGTVIGLPVDTIVKELWH